MTEHNDSLRSDCSLLALAGRATPGPWFTESGGIYNATRGYLIVPIGDSDQDRADAAYIAAASPAVVVDLLDALALIDQYGCRTFFGGRRCFDDDSGRERGADFGADAWCDACVARDALNAADNAHRSDVPS